MDAIVLAERGRHDQALQRLVVGDVVEYGQAGNLNLAVAAQEARHGLFQRPMPRRELLVRATSAVAQGRQSAVEGAD